MCEDAPCCGCCGRESYYYEEPEIFDERDYPEFDQDAWDGQPDDLTEQAEFEGADEHYGFFGEDLGDYWGD